MDELNLLRQVPYFSHLQEQDLQVLAEVAHEEHYRQDSIITDEGEIKNSLYFLVAGQVKVYLEKISGRAVTLSVLKKGNLFGEVCLLGGECPLPKVVALEDTTVIRFDKSDFLRSISNDPIILANMLRETCSRQSYDLDNVSFREGEAGEESKLQREISVFEKRFAIELEGIKLISQKIEELSGDTSAHIKEKSEQTISWVEQRAKDAIESSERRSKEVSEHAEKQAAQTIDLAEKTIGKALEEAKGRTDAVIKQIEEAISSTRAETEASLKKVELFWKKVKRSVTVLSTGVTIIVAILGYFGYREFYRFSDLKEKVEKDVGYIEKTKKDVAAFKNQYGELAVLKAMVLTIGRVRQESRLDIDEIEHFKRANISYAENRKNLLPYFASPDHEEHTPEVVAEALNNFLKLVYFSDDKIQKAEKDMIINACQWGLHKIKGRDFRYRLKSRDNIILFGQILQKRSSDYYADRLIPGLKGVLAGPGIDGNIKFTVAEALAALGEDSDACRNILVEGMKNDKVSCWRRYSAAIGLLYLKDSRGHDYLFTEMEPHQENSLKAALSLGEAVARSNAIKLAAADRQRLVNRIEEGINRTDNKFQKDYAGAILKKLNERDKLLSSK